LISERTMLFEMSQALAIYCPGKKRMWMKMSMELLWNDTDRGKTKIIGEMPAKVPLCPPQIM
jgi:hypothetical protein